MKNRLMSTLLAVVLTAGMLAGCGDEVVVNESKVETQGQSEERQEEVSKETKLGTLAEDMDLSALSFGQEGWKIDASQDYSGERFRRFDGLEYTRVVNTAGNELAEGYSIDDNPRTWLSELDTGMKAKTMWSASGEAYTAKLASAISSADIPDLTYVDMNQYFALVEAGVLADLTDELLEGDHPGLQEIYALNNNEALEMLKVDGRIYGIPRVKNRFDSGNIVFIRKDWMDKLGLEAPETYEDLADIARAFMQSDLDGNGKDDTYGIPCVAEYTTASGGMGTLCDVFLNVGGAAPQIWQVQEDGTVIYGSLMEEAKEALTMLNGWYEEGIIPADFATWDEDKMKQVYGDGKAGIFFGPMWSGSTTLLPSITLDEKAEWECFMLSGEEGERVRSAVGDLVTGVYVVRADFEAPEAFVYMADVNRFQVAPESFDSVSKLANSTNINYTPMMNSSYPDAWMGLAKNVYEKVHVTKELTTEEEVNAYLTEETNGLITQAVHYSYQLTHVAAVKAALDAGENPRAVTSGGENAVNTYKWYLYTGQALPVRAYADPEPVSNACQVTTESAKLYKTFLDTYEEEAYTKMIMGDTDGSSISDYFDKFVEGYLAQGGAEMTAEAQEIVGK